MTDETWPVVVDKELERVWEAVQYKKLMHVERYEGRASLVFEDGTRVYVESWDQPAMLTVLP